MNKNEQKNDLRMKVYLCIIFCDLKNDKKMIVKSSLLVFRADRQLSYTTHVTFRIRAFQALSVTKVMSKKKSVPMETEGLSNMKIGTKLQQSDIINYS